MSEIQTFANHLLNGLAYGLLLFILAAGLSLIFGMMDVINLSHGSFYLVGGFLGVGLVDDLGSWWLALAVSVGIVAVLGLITQISPDGDLRRACISCGVVSTARTDAYRFDHSCGRLGPGDGLGLGVQHNRHLWWGLRQRRGARGASRFHRHPDPRRVFGPGLRDPHPHADYRGRRGLGQLDRRFLGEPAHRDNP